MYSYLRTLHLKRTREQARENYRVLKVFTKITLTCVNSKYFSSSVVETKYPPRGTFNDGSVQLNLIHAQGTIQPKKWVKFQFPLHFGVVFY